MATIKSIQELIDTPQALQEFKNASPEVQTGILDSINPLFRRGTPEAREQVMQVVLGEQPGLTVREATEQAVLNFPRSVANLGRDVLRAATSPIKTGREIGKVAVGAAEQLIPGEQAQEPSFDAAAQFFTDRFGGFQNILRTFATDPAGFASDVSAGLSGVGSVISNAGRLARVGNIARTGQRISRIAPFIDPIGLPTRTVAAASNRVIPPIVRSAIKSAIKFPEGGSRVTETNLLNNVDAMADEFISRGLKPNRQSRNLIGEQITGIQNQVKGIISEGERQGVRIPITDVTASLDNLIDELEGISGLESPAGIRSVKRFRDDLLRKRIRSTGQAIRGESPFMTPTETQNLKKILNKSFAPSIEASVDAVRRVAKDKIRAGTKQILEAQFPQLQLLNAEQKTLINLQEAISKTIRLAEKEKTFSVPGLAIGFGIGGVTGAATGVGGGSALQTLGVGLGSATLAFIGSKVLANPSVQTSLARALGRANQIAARTGQLNLITQPSFQAGRLADIEQQQ